MKTLTLIAVLFLSFTAQATEIGDNWHVRDNYDDMTEKRTLKADAYDRELSLLDLATNEAHNSFGIECRLVGTSTKIPRFVFHTEDILAAQGADFVTLTIKVDNNKPVTFGAEMFSNSYDSGFMNFRGVAQHKLLAELKAGMVAKIRIAARGGRNRVDFSVSLAGFTKASNQILPRCGI